MSNQGHQVPTSPNKLTFMTSDMPKHGGFIQARLIELKGKKCHYPNSSFMLNHEWHMSSTNYSQLHGWSIFPQIISKTKNFKPTIHDSNNHLNSRITCLDDLINLMLKKWILIDIWFELLYNKLEEILKCVAIH